MAPKDRNREGSLLRGHNTKRRDSRGKDVRVFSAVLDVCQKQITERMPFWDRTRVQCWDGGALECSDSTRTQC